ncbi:MAG: M48 family metalloprotease [Syntrophaceae bacterium]|nr:M48 family metalloprotease [Syntrophaceae bacterium]
MIKFSIKLLIVWLSLLVLFGCGPKLKKIDISDPAVRAEREKQQQLLAENFLKQQSRLMRISGPILCSAAEFAPAEKVNAYYGLFFIHKDIISQEMKNTFVRMYGLGENPKVLYIAPDSPAEKGGIKNGDEILKINGKSFNGKEIYKIWAEERKKSTNINLTVSREKEVKSVTLNGIPSYSSAVLLSSDQRINAYADGTNVVIFMGIMNALSDEEISIIVGHEVAHNLLEHVSKTRGNAALGTVADVIVSGLLSFAARTPISTRGAFTNVGATVYSKEFEGEADYMGLYLSARAGFDIKQAADMWRKMAVLNPGSIKEKSYFSSHPSSPERYLAMEKTIIEIESKRKENKPLIPDKRSE